MVKGIAIVTLLVVLAMVTKPGQGAISCGQVDGTLAPCLSYLTQGGSTPPGPCCEGLKSLRAMVQTQPDRQAACECAKAAAARYPIKLDAASALPQKCGFPTNIPITPTTSSAVNICFSF